MQLPPTHYPDISHPYCFYRGRRLWWAFLCSSLSVFLGGLLMIVIWKASHRGRSNIGILLPQQRHWVHRKSIVSERVCSLRNAIREWALSVVSAQHLPGQVLMLLIFCLNIGSLLIYVILSAQPIEFCMEEYSAVFLVDVCFNICYLLYFGLRLLAAQDELLMWVDLRSLVDFLTITPTFVTLYTRRAWLGLRFIRALYILELPVILQILNILNSNTSLKLSRLVAILTGTLLTYAGIIHMLENTGDPWLDYSNAFRRSYFECVYFLIVTMSTVGYGDVYVTTTLGILFTTIFICIGLGLFASYVPEVVEIIVNRKRYGGSYTTISGKMHVVVCGHITLASASAFMNEFLHEDRGKVNVQVLFLGNFSPDPELEAFFRRNSLQVTFYQGDLRQKKDQERVMMHRAGACLILCDKFTSDHDKEDSVKLMSVIAIKTYCPNTRVIVQMLKHSSKAFVQKVPDWDWHRGDTVICLSELKLGFMAQSCLVPGLSTLLANLFTMQSEVEQEGDSWQHLYREGLYNEIYTEYLSSSFTGMSFAQASKLCFLKLRLLLIGIEYQSGDQDISVLVNPPSHIKVKKGTLGFLIASNASDARRASMYCVHCHSDLKDLSRMRLCRCPEMRDGSSHTSTMSLGLRRPSLGVLPFSPEQEKDWEVRERQVELEDARLDSTGMFHWSPPVSLQDITLNRQSARALALQDHVVACVFGERGSTLLGLGDFMMPLRASSLTGPELRTVVFLGDPDYFSREWPNIHYFPNIYFLPGSPLCGADLRAAWLERCAMCVVLSSLSASSSSSSSSSSSPADTSMQDTKTIVACLNIYHLRFGPEDAPVHGNRNRPPSLVHGHGSGVGGTHHGHSHVSFTHSKDSSTHIPTIPESAVSSEHSTGQMVPLLVELVNCSNVRFLNEADSRADFSCLNLTQAFSVGNVFSVDLLDSLMAATYFNANLPGLICTLVTGGDTPLLEAQLAEDNQLRGAATSSRTRALRQRSKLAQLALQDEPLCGLQCESFKDLFCQALDSLEILCFGLYRLLDYPNNSKRRFVITNPPHSLALLSTDKVFCSVPFHQSHLLAHPRRRRTPWVPHSP